MLLEIRGDEKSCLLGDKNLCYSYVLKKFILEALCFIAEISCLLSSSGIFIFNFFFFEFFLCIFNGVSSVTLF